MVSRLFSSLIEPRADQPDVRSRELILNCLLIASILLALGELLDLLFGFIFLGHHYVEPRLIGICMVAVSFAAIYRLAHHQQRLAAGLVVGIFFAVASYLAYHWGAMTPTGVLLFGLIIVMAGVLLGSRYSVYLAAAVSLLLIGLEIGKARGIIRPDLAWLRRPSSVSDALALGSIYGVMAVVSWLFNHQMEQSLKRARQSEAALLRQRNLLEVKVEERSRQLAAAQLEKVQQIYRFAELGRISSALFHDLANHLTSVSLDIEGLVSPEKPQIMRRIQNDIRYIDNVVQRVRTELRGEQSLESFAANRQIEEIIKIIGYRARQAGIKIRFSKPKTDIMYRSDVTRFRQVIINLLNNAIDAYQPIEKPARPQPILIELKASTTTLVIRVTDHGHGISKANAKRIFQPFYTTKSNGTGIGLFIVQQIVERDLLGKISVDCPAGGGTVFTISLPCADKESSE